MAHHTLQLARYPDAEGDQNRGWQVDLLTAEVDGDVAGYAAISFIPRARFERHYAQGIYDWERLINGRALPEKRDDLRLQEARHPFSSGRSKEVYQKEWEFFQAYHVDRPRMDFIRVFNEHEDRIRYAEVIGCDRVRTSRKNYQGVGLGSLLYREAARWMFERYALPLYSSDLMSESASLAWTRLQRTLPDAVLPSDRARREKQPQGRMILGQHVPPWVPEWTKDATLKKENGDLHCLGSGERLEEVVSSTSRSVLGAEG